ncbi:leucine-rich repeat-containing protein 46 [Octopus sinensis]|nr:leucine-rich repeat-containing protein 46 [Octopus sinensis]
MMLIIKRNLPREAAEWSDKDVLDAVAKISHLQLDGESIDEIDFTQFIDEEILTNLYLQNNKIKQLNHLDILCNLQLLDLSNNEIEFVENISKLHQLVFLDLSNNFISHVDIDEFPQSLMILHLSGNPCCDNPDYRGRIIQDLQNLNELDGQPVGKEEQQECGFVITRSDDSDENDDADKSTKVSNILEKYTCTNKESKDSRIDSLDQLPDKELQLHGNNETDQEAPTSQGFLNSIDTS